MTDPQTGKSLLSTGVKVFLAVVIAMVVGTVVGEVFLPVPSMTLSAAEMALNVPSDDGSGLVFHQDFLRHVSQLKTAREDGGAEVQSPRALSFVTKPPGACRSFQLVYSARDRQDPSAPGRLRIRPRGPPGCTARMDVSPPREPMVPEIPIDHAIDLLLGSSVPGDDAMVVNQRAERLEATVFKARGGPLSLCATDVEAETTVELAGSELAIQSLFVSTKDKPDGALVATLVSKVPPSVIVDKHDVGLLYRLKTIQAVYELASKVVGAVK